MVKTMRACVGALAGSMLLLVPAAAHADSITKTDERGDTAAALDITNVAYRNADRVAAARIRIPELERRGQAALVIAQPRSDVAYYAIVRVRDDGSLVKKLMYATAATRKRTSCKIGATWNVPDGLVTVRVPQGCLKALSGLKYYYMSVRTGDQGGDVARPAGRLRCG
jgi:hypothetical protein